ncbi:MAG: SH3 domain-containing protein [Chloroflexota bacterium]
MTVRSFLPIVLCTLLLFACSPGPIQRPLEGAPVGQPSGPPEVADAPPLSDVPPTLSPGGPLQGGGSPSRPAQAGGSPSPSPSPSPLPGIAGYVIVATDGRGANLREGPSTSAKVITTLAEGTAVEVLGEPTTVEGRAWRQIRGAGREGWVVDVVVRRR